MDRTDKKPGSGKPERFAKTHVTSSEEETFLLAKKIGARFRGDEIVLLIGELGAGKTVFAKGLAAGLGVDDVHQVCSPSYTLVNIYKGRVPVFHVDLFRLEGQDEIASTGWEDCLGQGVVIVEWAEKLEPELDGIRVVIEVIGNEKRRVTIS